MEITKYPKPILRNVSSPVKEFGKSEESLLKDMRETMYYNKGIGLAAPQVGISLRIAVVDTGSGLINLVNPRVLRREGKEGMEEGCLSINGACVNVKRAKRVLVEFLDKNGNTTTLEADGLLARAIQHEIDHLNGRLIIDYLNPIKKFFIKRSLK